MLHRIATVLALAIGVTTEITEAAELAQLSPNSDDTFAVDFVEVGTGIKTVVSASFGSVGTPTFFGSYVSPEASHFGAIEASATSATWRLIDRMGGAAGEIALGRSTDLFVAGGDFDGDGTLDPAVVESVGNTLRARIKPGAFSGAPGSEIVRSFGKKGDRALTFFANLDGTSDRIGVVRKRSGFPRAKPRYLLRLTAPVTGSKRTVVLAAVGELDAAPLPLRQIDGTDALVVQRKLIGATTGVRVTVLRKNGKKRAGVTFSGEGRIVVGDLDPSEPGEEVGFHSDTRLTIFNPASRVRRSVPIDARELVDPVTVALYTATPSGPLACGGTPGICGCNMLDETDGYKVGFVYKAKSDTYGGIVAVLPNPCGRSTTAVSVLDTSCNLVEALSDNGYGNADQTGVRHHFKRRDNHTGSYYRNLVGSIILRLEGTDACYFIENPAQTRID